MNRFKITGSLFLVYFGIAIGLFLGSAAKIPAPSCGELQNLAVIGVPFLFLVLLLNLFGGVSNG